MSVVQDKKYRLRIKLDIGGGVVGPGKAELMRKIDALGSISAAAREMDINYRRAWFLLETLSQALGRPVVLTTKGGAGKGGAKLTEAGRAILDAYGKCVEIAEKKTAATIIKLSATLDK